MDRHFGNLNAVSESLQKKLLSGVNIQAGFLGTPKAEKIDDKTRKIVESLLTMEIVCLSQYRIAPFKLETFRIHDQE